MDQLSTEPLAVTARYAESRPRNSEWRRFATVFLGRKLAVFGLVVVVGLFLTAVFGPWLTPYDPTKVDYTIKLVPPSLQHLLGTDALGRDMLARIVYGAQNSLMVSVGAVVLAVVFGQTLGLVAAYFGGTLNAVIMRLIDAMMTFPMILNALIITSLLGGGIKNVILALGIAMIPEQCRMMASQVLTIKERDHVVATRALGGRDLHIMLRHIVPNAFAPLLVLTTIELGTAILTESGLSFLGLGIAPPAPTWGGMVNDGYKYLMSYPLLSFAPGVVIMLAVFSFNMAGDGLRDTLDPRLRGRI